MNFKVGDIVCVIHPNLKTNKICLYGNVGIIKFIKNRPDQEAENIGVEFQEDVGGHDIGGYVLIPFGYYVRSRDIQQMEPFVVAFQRSWQKAWLPKLQKIEKPIDVSIPLEDF